MMKRIATAAVAAMFALTSLTGCSAGGKGGDTTCKEYKAMSSSQKKVAILGYYKAKGKDPSNGAITLATLSASAFCATAGHDSDPIKKIDG